ncbi:MAG: transporter [Zavarzinella sp.]
MHRKINVAIGQLFLCCWGTTVLAQAPVAPTAKLGLPQPIPKESNLPATPRGQAPDSLWDEELPPAKLGTIRGTSPADNSVKAASSKGTPTSESRLPPATFSDIDNPPPLPPPPGSFNDGPTLGAPSNDPGGFRQMNPGDDPYRSANNFDRLSNLFGGGVGLDPQEWDRRKVTFQSDHDFPWLSSPLSNPFMAEDPRSLTEIRPMFLYQTIPGSQYLLRGGNAVFFGGQARLAFTERISMIVNKIGWQSFNPGTGSTLGGATGFTELHFGPKFVLIRDPQEKVISSLGLTFQLPIGSSAVYQNTGSLTLMPYWSYARQIYQSVFGGVGLINNVGYAFGTSDARSDYFFNSFHLSLDLFDQHNIFPTMEINWFHYTTDGTTVPETFEARDLGNLGAQAASRDFLTISPGVRFRMNEGIFLGLHTEFPLLGTRDLLDFRFGVDLIWRY